ncbi:MAG: EAL domain-containing protein [Thiomicrospira sp.]|uniref:EAL domain-containing protein n=1 Tax=Thiomicrospira sp. TaxID=935 RepID=UPI0019FBFCC2|nr:EAL domain-containing protein [Thiomicrospira sp.]MBE0493545.1 EAL domain-containing protein [Thiomicrospira sp.]
MIGRRSDQQLGWGLLLGLLFVFYSTTLKAKETFVLGVLAFQPKPIVEARWQPIIDHLNRQLTDIELTLRPLYYDELSLAVARRELDFVLTNSAFYVELAHSQGLSSPLVSLMTLHDGIPLRGFGGVVVVKNDRTDILDLIDLKGQRIASPKEGSFGGYMMQAYEIKLAGVEPDSYSVFETEMPHDLAVNAVLDDRADAAFVRTGVLENMQARGLINLDHLRVLNPQELAGFPFLISTQIYPEWPLAAMPHIRMEYAGQVTSAFLAIPYNSPVLRNANFYGFSVPADYEPIRELMRSLRIRPYHILPEIGWKDIWQARKVEVMMSWVALAIILLLGFLLMIYNQRLSNSLTLVKRNEENLRISSVAFETQEAILITDANQTIIRVNHAFTDITGFSEKEAVGQTPRILKSGVHDDEFYQQMWADIIETGGWRGEIWNRRKDGEIYPEHQVITVIRNPKGQITHYLSTFSDITMRKLNEERIHKLAFYDPLTGLANRRLLEDHIAQAISASSRNLHYCALLFIDLDHFKNLNDTLGHKLGDELLKQVAERLKSCVREGDTVARPGGDEFIILLQDIGFKQEEAANHAKLVSEKILNRFNEAYPLSESQYVLTASIGINLFIDHYESADEIMKRSDLAMYQAKAQGRNTIRFFDPSMQEAASKRSEIEFDLRRAIELKEFVLYYQPKYCFSGELHGYEALIRWQHPQKGLVTPFDFIGVAEETGLIIPIGKWILHQACLTLQAWQEQPDKQNLKLAINISARQFHQPDFVDSINHALSQYNIDASKLELEITESMLMDDIQDTAEKMHALKTLGINFALDDFGTGYSSLNYLKSLPLGSLKVDQSFVRDMLVDENDAAIVKTIITLAKELQLAVVAEGVEEPEQARILHDLGCDLLQGYLYGRPSPDFVRETR